MQPWLIQRISRIYAGKQLLLDTLHLPANSQYQPAERVAFYCPQNRLAQETARDSEPCDWPVF